MMPSCSSFSRMLPFEWASNISSPFNHIINDIAADDDHHFYIVGQFKEAIDMNPDPGPAYLNSLGSTDAYITKYQVCSSIDDQVFGDEGVLIANAVAPSYQWLDCDNDMSPIPGATAQTYTNPAGGYFAVEIINGDCSVTTECFLMESFSIDEYRTLALEVAPNPTRGEVQFQFPKVHEQLHLKVSDISGRTIF